MRTWTGSLGVQFNVAGTARKLEGDIADGHWTERVPEQAWLAEASCFWADQHAAIEIAVDLPATRRGNQQAVDNFDTFFVGALKRRAVEVCERKLFPEDYEKFQAAKAVEAKNF